MNTEQHPIDENLRLIMSADQEQWLGKQINEARKIIRAMVIILLAASLWAAMDFVDAFAQYNKAGCYILATDAPDYQELRDQFAAEGLKPCPPEGAGQKGIDWTDIRILAATFSVILMLVSVLTILRHLFLLRRYKGYLTDHQAFLKKYNRASVDG